MKKYIPICPKCDIALAQEEVSDGYEFVCHECDEDFYEFEVKWREQMIDYEITVNVEGLSHDEKKRVQDAFFKLGLIWWDGTRYNYLDKGCYTNTMTCGEVMEKLMWADVRSAKPTHTIEQVMELAGMKTDTKPFDLESALAGEPIVLQDGTKAYGRYYEKEVNYEESLGMKTKPFDLEKALAGEPVVTRKGKEVSQLTLFESTMKYKLAGVVDGDICMFTENGVYMVGDSHFRDLFMKVKTHNVNGFEVPAPVTDPDQLKGEKSYFLPAVYAKRWFTFCTWEGDNHDFLMLQRNIIFLTEDDAAANAKAMAGVNPYGDCDE